MAQFSSRPLPKFEPGHRDGDGCVFPDPGHFAPRQKNPVNPILTALREDWEGDIRGYGLWFACATSDLVADGVDLTSEQRIHARLVLERLAAFTG